MRKNYFDNVKMAKLEKGYESLLILNLNLIESVAR
jgi:hypothetical protein